MKIKDLFKKTKYITVSVTPLNSYKTKDIKILVDHAEEHNIIVIENRNYTVKKGCIVKLIGCIEANTNDIILVSGEQFLVKPYTGYDVYGEDYVVYSGKEYILNWDSKVQNSIIDCS